MHNLKIIAHQYYSCTLVCNLIRNAKKNRPFPSSNSGQISASVYEDHRLERTDLTIVHDSPSIRAGPETALFRKLEDCELSDKIFVLKGRH